MIRIRISRPVPRTSARTPPRWIAAPVILTLVAACGGGGIQGEPDADTQSWDEAVAEESAAQGPDAVSDTGTVQGLEQGRWTGSMVPPEGVEAGVAYEVTSAAGRLQIVIHVPGAGEVPVQEVEVEDGRISLQFDMGGTVTCELEEGTSGVYEGTCTDARGQEGSLTMVPPEEG